MGHLAASVKNQLEQLAAEFERRLNDVPFYAAIPSPAKQALARHYLSLAAAGLETRDLSLLAEFLQARSREVLERGYAAEAMLQDVDAFEDTLWPLVNSMEDARFLGKATSRLRGVVSQEIAQKLTASELKFRQMVEGSPVGIFRTTPAGQIAEANPAFLRIVGYESLEAINQVGVPALYENADDRRRLLDSLAQGPVWNFETRFRHPDGQVVDVLINAHLTPSSDGKGEFVEGIIENVTERKQSQKAVQQRLAETMLLNRVMSATASSLEPAAILHVVCQELSQALHLPQAGVALLQPDGATMRVMAHYRADGASPAVGLIISLKDNPGSQYVLEHRTPLVISDIQADDRQLGFREAAQKLGIASMLLAPLVVRERAIGTLGLDSFEHRQFSDDEIALVQNIAAAISQTLQNAQFYQAMRESEAKFKALADNLSVGIFIHQDGLIRYVGREGTRLLGYDDPDELVGRPIVSLIHETERARIADMARRRVAGEPVPDHYETRLLKKDGAAIDVVLYNALIEYEGRTATQGTFTDMTEQRHAEALARLDEIRLEALLRLNQMAGASFQEIAHYALDAGVQVTQSKIGYLAFMNEDESVLTMYAWSKTAMDQCAVIDKPIVYPVVETGLWGEAVRQRKPVITNDYAAPSSFKKGYPAGHVHVARHMNIPVFDGERIVAVAGVGNKEAGYDEADVRQLALLMEGMWQLVRRKRLEEQIQESLERRGRQVQISTEVAQEIAAVLALRDLFNRVVTLIKERFGYYHAQIFRFDVTANAMVLAAGYGDPGQKMLAAVHLLPMGSGIVGTAAATRQPVLATDVAKDPDWRSNPNLPDTKGELAVPILWQGQVLGVLDVQSEQAGALTAEDQLLLEGLCGQVAIAMENTRLRQEMEESLRELNAAYRSMSREGWQSFRQVVRLPGGYIFDRTAVRQADDVWVPEIETAVKRESLTIPATEQGAAVMPLAVPGGEIVGALGIYDDPQRPLSPEDLELVESVAEQVAQALESARLSQETQAALAETGVLYQTSQALSAANTLDDVLNAFRKGIELPAIKLVSLSLFNRPWIGDDAPEYVETVASWNAQTDKSLDGDEIGRVGSRYEIQALPMLKLLRLDAPLVISDVETYPALDETTRALFLDEFGARSAIFLPLVVAGQWIGFVDVYQPQPFEFREVQLRRLMALVGQAAVAIQSIQRLQETQARVQREQQLRQMAERLRGQPNVDSMLRTLARELGQALGRRVFVSVSQGEKLAQTVDFTAIETQPQVQRREREKA